MSGRWKRGELASDRLDKRDILDLAERFIPTRRCVCGRITHDSYVCIHCGEQDGLNWGSQEKPSYPTRQPEPTR